VVLAFLKTESHQFPASFFELINIIIVLQYDISLISDPQLGGPGFDFGVCSPRNFGEPLRSPRYPLIVVLSFSGSSAKTCPNWREHTSSYANFELLHPAVDVRVYNQVLTYNQSQQ
jgi:hypothetical protein